MVRTTLIRINVYGSVFRVKLFTCNYIGESERIGSLSIAFKRNRKSTTTAVRFIQVAVARSIYWIPVKFQPLLN